MEKLDIFIFPEKIDDDGSLLICKRRDGSYHKVHPFLNTPEIEDLLEEEVTPVKAVRTHLNGRAKKIFLEDE